MENTTNRDAVWRKVEELGCGGFGSVTLLKNEKNDEYVAIKKVKFSAHELDAEKKKRWISEVTIMKQLKHENIVSAFETPPGIIHLVGDSGLPILTMEYCCGGSLRKVLGKPENSCGLTEVEIRHIARDISSAIEYLHSQPIIHRDIKPDNIVLQPTEDGVIYKLIDLGYAKEPDEKDLLYSLAGTKYYLAPELLTVHRKYTGTVDFWSFGITLFEVITGFRPFLASFADDLYHWHAFVSRKQDTHIFIEQNGDRVIYSTRIPRPNNLCRPFCAYLEDFLRSILKFDPQDRGGGAKNPTCFQSLKDKLDQKIIHIFSVPTNELLSYPVNDKVTISDLRKNHLEKETRIPYDEQELLLSAGQTPELQKPAAHYCVEPSQEEENIIFLYRRHDAKNSDVQRQKHWMSDQVVNMIKNPGNLYSYQDQKKIWGQAVHYCIGIAKDYNRTSQAQKAAMLSLLRENMVFTRYANKMELYKNKLTAKLEFFKFSQEFDIEKYQAQASQEQSDGKITSESMLKNWEKTLGKAEAFNAEITACQNLEERCAGLRTRIVELQRSPFARTKQSETVDNAALEVLKLYRELTTATTKDERRKMTDRNTEMVQLMTACVQQYEYLISDLYKYIDKVFSYKSEVLETLRNIEVICHSMEDAIEKLMKFQRQRQETMWNLVKLSLKKGASLSSSSMSQSQVFSRSIYRKGSDSSSSDSHLPENRRTSLGNRTMERSISDESSMVLNENDEQRKKVDELLSSLWEETTLPDSDSNAQQLEGL